jgi:hypothetical protein
MTPRLNPFLVAENIAAARSLLADCTELRKRIESLQQDIFNFSQESLEKERENTIHEIELKNARAAIERLQSAIDRSRNDLSNQQKLSQTASDLSARFGNKTASERSTENLQRSLWNQVFTVRSSPENTPELVPIENIKSVRDAANMPASTMNAAIQNYNLLRSQAIEDAAADHASYSNQLLRQDIALSTASGQLESLIAAHQQAINDLQIMEARRELRMRLWERNKAQADDEGIGLFRRLQDSLALYAELSGQLRVAIHTVEFGQSEAFGMKIAGFDADDLSLHTRYIFSGVQDSAPSFPGLINTILDRPWASLDWLGLLLIQAESRHRRAVHTQKVRQIHVPIAGEFGNNGTASHTINFDHTKGTLLLPAPARVIGFRAVNEGPAVGISAKIVPQPKPADLVAEPEEDSKAAYLRDHSLRFRYDWLPTATPATPAMAYSDPSQFMNRNANGELRVSLSKRDKTSDVYDLVLEFWLAH